MGENKIKASIVIPTRNKLDHLTIVLKSFQDQVTDKVEVIIIFDGCEKSVIKNFNKLKLNFIPKVIICKNNVGRAAARNKGIESAKGKIVIFSDDDVIPCKNFIKKHIDGHKENCVFLGEVKYLNYSNDEINYLLNNIGNVDYKKLDRDSIKKGLTVLRRFYRPVLDKIIKPISFLTTNVSVEKKDLVRVGMFDEKFTGWGYEDIDLGYRLGINNIKFKRDSTAVNYHINHPVNKTKKGNEARVTLNYFLNKIKKDNLSKVLLVSYFRLAKIFGKF